MSYSNLSEAVAAARPFAAMGVDTWYWHELGLTASRPLTGWHVVIQFVPEGLRVRYFPPPRPLRPVLPVGAALN